jgi:hypothetical protein
MSCVSGNRDQSPLQPNPTHSVEPGMLPASPEPIQKANLPMSTIITIPLNKLTRSARNVPKSGGESIDGLASSRLYNAWPNRRRFPRRSRFHVSSLTRPPVRKRTLSSRPIETQLKAAERLIGSAVRAAIRALPQVHCPRIWR